MSKIHDYIAKINKEMAENGDDLPEFDIESSIKEKFKQKADLFGMSYDDCVKAYILYKTACKKVEQIENEMDILALAYLRDLLEITNYMTKLEIAINFHAKTKKSLESLPSDEELEAFKDFEDLMKQYL